MKVVGLILGGGTGSRLQPLTRERSKPAVPIAGKYRLVDIPISNCLNSDIRNIFLLTQFNSVSLHQHIAATYRFDQFSGGMCEFWRQNKPRIPAAGFREQRMLYGGLCAISRMMIPTLP